MTVIFEYGERKSRDGLVPAPSARRRWPQTRFRFTSDPPRSVRAASAARRTPPSPDAGADEAPLTLEAEGGKLLFHGRAGATRTFY